MDPFTYSAVQRQAILDALSPLQGPINPELVIDEVTAYAGDFIVRRTREKASPRPSMKRVRQELDQLEKGIEAFVSGLASLSPETVQWLDANIENSSEAENYWAGTALLHAALDAPLMKLQDAVRTERAQLAGRFPRQGRRRSDALYQCVKALACKYSEYTGRLPGRTFSYAAERPVGPFHDFVMAVLGPTQLLDDDPDAAIREACHWVKR